MILDISIIPKSKKFSIHVRDGRIKIAVKSPPERNMANMELVKELSKLTGGKEVKIISGKKSRKKKIKIGIAEDEWEKILAFHNH